MAPTPTPVPTPASSDPADPGAGARWLHAATVALLALLLCIPGAMTVASHEPGGADDEEDRVLAGFPPAPGSLVDARAWPAAFNVFMDDQLVWRRALVRANSRGMLALRTSSSTEVVVGRDGFLFLNGPVHGMPIEDSLGQTRYSREQLDAAVQRYGEWHRWLDRRGIAYVVVIAPNKASVYPDQLPARRRRASADTTITDQLVSALRARTDVPVVDLREPVRAARGEGGLESFLRTDSHWSAWGASVAQRHVIDAVRRAAPGTGRPAARFTPDMFELRDRAGGDLARLLGLRATLREQSPVLDEAGTALLCDDLVVSTAGGGVTTTCPAVGGRVLMFRDSFATALIPFLSSSFGTVRYRTGRPREKSVRAAVRDEPPDVVIEELVERKLPRVPEHPPAADR